MLSARVEPLTHQLKGRSSTSALPSSPASSDFRQTQRRRKSSNPVRRKPPTAERKVSWLPRVVERLGQLRRRREDDDDVGDRHQDQNISRARIQFLNNYNFRPEALIFRVRLYTDNRSEARLELS